MTLLFQRSSVLRLGTHRLQRAGFRGGIGGFYQSASHDRTPEAVRTQVSEFDFDGTSFKDDFARCFFGREPDFDFAALRGIQF